MSDHSLLPNNNAALRALSLVARLASTRDCFFGLMLVSRSIHAAAPAYIEHVHFPKGTDDDTILRVLDGSPQLRDVKLYCSVGYAAVERAVTLARLERLQVTRIDYDDGHDSECDDSDYDSDDDDEGLQEFPPSLCDCTRLKSLSVSVTALRVMPELMCQQLSTLEMLSLSGCRKLVALPESTGQLSSLATLDLSGCERLVALPESLSQLSESLSTLNLSNCQSLAALPDWIGQLSSLTTLNLSGIFARPMILTALPESIGQLSSLTTLNLSRCGRLIALPKSIGQLSSLTTLNLYGCKRIKALPGKIRQLTRQLPSLMILRCRPNE